MKKTRCIEKQTHIMLIHPSTSSMIRLQAVELISACTDGHCLDSALTRTLLPFHLFGKLPVFSPVVTGMLTIFAMCFGRRLADSTGLCLTLVACHKSLESIGISQKFTASRLEAIYPVARGGLLTQRLYLLESFLAEVGPEVCKGDWKPAAACFPRRLSRQSNVEHALDTCRTVPMATY